MASGRRVSVKSREQGSETQLREEMECFRRIEIPDLGVRPVRLYVAVGLDRHQKQAQSCKVFVLGQIFSKRRLFDLVQMRIDSVHTAVVHDQLGRCLFTDFGNAGHIIGAVAHERLDMDEAVRGHLISFEDIGCVVVLYDCLPLPGLGDPYACVLSSDLQKVPVSRHK